MGMRRRLRQMGESWGICSSSGDPEIYVHSGLTGLYECSGSEGLDGIFDERVRELVRKLDLAGFSQLSLEDDDCLADDGEFADKGSLAAKAKDLGTNAILSMILGNSEK